MHLWRIALACTSVAGCLAALVSSCDSTPRTVVPQCDYNGNGGAYAVPFDELCGAVPVDGFACPDNAEANPSVYAPGSLVFLHGGYAESFACKVTCRGGLQEEITIAFTRFCMWRDANIDSGGGG